MRLHICYVLRLSCLFPWTRKMGKFPFTQSTSQLWGPQEAAFLSNVDIIEDFKNSLTIVVINTFSCRYTQQLMFCEGEKTLCCCFLILFSRLANWLPGSHQGSEFYSLVYFSFSVSQFLYRAPPAEAPPLRCHAFCKIVSTICHRQDSDKTCDMLNKTFVHK